MRWVSLRNCCFLEMTKKCCKMYHQICSMENNIRFWLFYLPFPFPLLLSKSMDICQEKKDTLMLFMMMWHDISIPPAWVCLLALEYIPTSGENHKKWPVMQTKSLFLPNPKNHKRRSCFPFFRIEPVIGKSKFYSHICSAKLQAPSRGWENPLFCLVA